MQHLMSKIIKYSDSNNEIVKEMEPPNSNSKLNNTLEELKHIEIQNDKSSSS